MENDSSAEYCVQSYAGFVETMSKDRKGINQPAAVDQDGDLKKLAICQTKHNQQPIARSTVRKSQVAMP
jgi:hypothetical protein